LEIAADKMKEAGYRVLHIRGGMNEATRGYVLHTAEAWAAEGVPFGLLVQIVSGNAGLNLQHCARVVFLSSHWNPTVIDQAVARSYRMGQTRRVEVHHLLVADGAMKNLDRLIVRSHLKKRELAREICDKLIPDSAIDATYVINLLNSVCPEDTEEDSDKTAVKNTASESKE
jgi:SNF2 family DNA or RNA helicase